MQYQFGNPRLTIFSMPPRIIIGAPHQDLKTAILDDLLSHSEESTYDIIFVPHKETTEAQYDYCVTCTDFENISKDRDYLARCLIQATVEHRTPDQTIFTVPQPLKVSRIPKT